MVIKVPGKDGLELKSLDLFWCDCKHPIDERNIRFKVQSISEERAFGSFDSTIIANGTICRFCPHCYTMHETPNQVMYLDKNDLSNAITRIIIEKEKHQ